MPRQSGLPPSCPSGVVPEDQALYVCEAQNVFGKVQVEARLVVTGHGSLVDLEKWGEVGRWGHPQGGPPRPPILWERCVHSQVLREEHLGSCFLGSVPQEMCPLTPLGSLGEK